MKNKIFSNLSAQDVLVYLVTGKLEHLKNYSLREIAQKIYNSEEINQNCWNILKQLDIELFNKKRAFEYKKRFHTKYAYLIQNINEHLPKLDTKKSLYNITLKNLKSGIDHCVQENSDYPFFQDFYDNYFCVYNVDSIIDFAYSLSEEGKEMCKTLLISSIIYVKEAGYHPKQAIKEKIPEIELSDVYFEVRNKDEVWYDDNILLAYLKKFHADEILNASYPMDGYLTSQKDGKFLKKKYSDYNPRPEKRRFLTIVKKAYDELSLGSNEEVNKVEEHHYNGVDVLSLESNKDPNIQSEEHSQNDEINNGGNIQDSFKKTNLHSISGKAMTHNLNGVEVLDNPITEAAEEVSFDIMMPTNAGKRNSSRESVIKTKGDIDYSEQQRISQKIGGRGEELVLINELKKVKKWGLLEELVSQVRRVSLESDDYGYDILSYDKNGNELYLEVKTTKQNKNDFSFILTQNELKHAKMYGYSYCIVIVFDILNKPRIWYMGNPFVQEPYKVALTPLQYRVDVKTE